MKTSLLLVFVIAPSWVQAGVLEKSSLYGAGEMRGAFLARGVGARAVSMGEAFVAVADDSSAVAWNPGGLGQIESLDASAMYDAAGQGVGQSFVAAAVPLGGFVAGAGITMLSYGSYVKRDAVGEEAGTESLTDLGVMGAIGVENPSWLGGRGWTGIGIEFVNEAVAGAAFAASLGTVLPVSSRVSVGLAARHLGPAEDGFSLPAEAHAGASCRLEGVSLALDLGYGLVDELAAVALGAEAVPHRTLALRAGYKWLAEDQGLGGLNGLTAGLGFKLGSFGVDYAYQPFGELAQSHRVALVYSATSALAALERDLAR